MTGERRPQTAETTRIKRFRLALIKAIPRFPNDRAALQHMRGKHLGDLLIDYVSWRSRYVGTRPRSVTIEPAALADPKWSSMSAEIGSFLDKVRRGDDLTPHLSIKPHTQDYTPAAHIPGATAEERRLDKDFVLNTKGYHHFHLGAAAEKKGHTVRTNDVLFAEVTRDEFNVIAIFTHEVFDLGSAEQTRLSQVHDGITCQRH
jgi:hypothetical protein